MSSLIQKLQFGWDYIVRGRHRLIPLSDFNYPAVDDGLMNFLTGMYQGHGAETVRSGNWVIVDGGQILTRGAYFDQRQNPENFSLQMDFVTVLPSGHHIVESFGGIGTDVGSAMADACKGFQDSTFHALFAALLNRSCDHVDRDTWTIGGTPRKITFGWLRTRGHFPANSWLPIYARIQAHIENSEIGPGLHWVRYFYCFIPGNPPIMEVLLDNEVSTSLEKLGITLPWPVSDSFYSVRLFFILQDS